MYFIKNSCKSLLHSIALFATATFYWKVESTCSAQICMYKCFDGPTRCPIHRKRAQPQTKQYIKSRQILKLYKKQL